MDDRIAYGVMLAIVVFVITNLALAYTYDPHAHDPNYCQVWAHTQDFRITVPYIPNHNVAERLCNCTTTYYQNVTIDGKEYPPMYDRSIACTRI